MKTKTTNAKILRRFFWHVQKWCAKLRSAWQMDINSVWVNFIRSNPELSLEAKLSARMKS